MNVIEGLNKLVEYSPDQIFINLFILCSMFQDEFLKVASLTVLDDRIDSDIFFVDLVVIVFKEMYITVFDKNVDFTDNVLFFLGGDRGEGYFFDDDSFITFFMLCFVDIFG